MRINSKITAVAVAAALAFGSMATPAAAVPPVKSYASGVGGTSTGAKVLGVCLFGGAFGLIFSALAKGQAYNDKKIELTRDEAFAIAGTCGLASGWVMSKWKRK
jgi:hypothetical protein